MMLMSEKSTEFAATVKSPLVMDLYPQLVKSVCNFRRAPGFLADAKILLRMSCLLPCSAV